MHSITQTVTNRSNTILRLRLKAEPKDNNIHTEAIGSVFERFAAQKFENNEAQIHAYSSEEKANIHRKVDDELTDASASLNKTTPNSELPYEQINFSLCLNTLI